jgi:hypothetical protein
MISELTLRLPRDATGRQKSEYVRLTSRNANCHFLLSERRGLRCGVPMTGNNMTNQNEPGQLNQAPGQKPGQQQGGGSKPGQQSQAPGKENRNPKKPLNQTSNSDT